MKHSNFLRRSLAMLVLLATLLSLVPNVFAAEDDGIPSGDMLVAEFNENGELVYTEADESTKAAMRAASFNAQATQAFSAKQRIAYFIDVSQSESTAYNAFTISNANIDNLTTRGVTDFFVMTKNKAGTFSTTALKNVITHAGTAANVYAWMHSALDDTYLKNNKTAAQYHFRVGHNNSANGGDTRQGYVDLENTAYRTYFNGLVDQVEACSGVDGVLLDSVRFGADYYGWGDKAKSYMGTTAYNAAAKALAAHHGYTYSTSGGYYVYKGTTTADYTSLTTFVNANSANAQKYFNYRRDVITGFIQSVRESLGSSLYLGVTAEPEWNNTLYEQSTYGQVPSHFKTYVSNGFVVAKTFMDMTSKYTTYTWPTNIAKLIAKAGCNVFVGVDGRYPNHSTYTYLPPDSAHYQAQYITDARFLVNGDVSYGGDILGAAMYMAGSVSLAKVTISSKTSTTPNFTVDVVAANVAMKSFQMRFHEYNDTNAMLNLSASGLSPSGTANAGSLHSYTGSGSKYYSGSTTNSAGATVYYVGMDNDPNVAAYGTLKVIVPLKNVNVGYDKPYFFRVGFYTQDASANRNNTYACPVYCNVVWGDHTSCSFTDTVVVAADCASGGYVISKCGTCGYDYVKTTAKTTTHNYQETGRVNATCEAAGSISYKCSVCSATKTDTIAALGHDYQAVVTPPTCLDGGYTTYTCSRDSSHTYVSDQTPAAGHNFVGGVCTVCGFSLAKLIHFKENSEENTWDWELIGGSNLGFDTSTDGAMYGTTDGMVQSYFYVNPTGIGNLGYKIVENDVIQIRMRVRTTQSAATTATPSVSLEMASGTEYGATISGNSIDLNTTEWQIVTIPITGYTVGDTIERIRINPFGEELAAANVEIDYIHFGQAEAVPITVTFYNYDGKVLQASPIAPGTKATFYGETPTKPTSAGFTYTFTGWMATSDSTGGTLITDLSTVSFSENTALTAQFEAEFTDAEPLNSNKRLVDDDGDLEDYTYDIQIDASTYGQNVTINKEYKTPLDIVIVMDRSLSTAFHADESKDFTLSSYSAANLTKLNNYLNTLDKTKPEGYYTASNWLQASYTGSGNDIYGGGFISYENMRYNTTKKYWEVWQTITYEEAMALKTAIPKDTTKYADFVGKTYDEWTFLTGASVMYNVYNWKYQNEIAGSWVPVTTAFQEFFTRRDYSYDTHGEPDETTYPRTNVLFRIGISRRGLMQVALDDFVDQVYATTDQLPQGQYHRISIVGYGYGAYKAGRKADYSYLNSSGDPKSGSYTTTAAGDPGVTCDPITLDSAADVATLKSYIDNPFAFGSTYTDDALKLANEHITAMNSKARGAQGVVVLFTDGCPTYTSNFIIETANAALVAAKSIKDTGTKIFALGFMGGLNSATAVKTWDATATEAVKANNFLHLVSSNYPSSTAMTSTGSGSNQGYYLSTVDGAALADHFAAIFTTTHSTSKVETQITGSLVIKDIVTREWDVLKDSSNALDITVERCDYIGLGDFKDPVVLDSSLYTLTTTELTDSSGALTGELEIQVEWTDAPNAWLREAEAAEADGYMGYELLITIGITLDRDSTIGGNNIPTNSPDSGIFYPTNPDLDHNYDVPNVNVEMIYDYAVHDYFLDLYNESADFDLIDVLSNTDQAEYKLGVYEDLYTRTVAVDGLNNRFVNIEHFAGTDIYSEYLEAGTTAWSPTFYEPEFDFESDLSGIPVRYEVRPITSNVDSLGRAAFTVKKPVQTASVNYYAPKYMVVDYHTTAVIDMGNETAAKLGSEVVFEDNGALDATGNNAKYNFRYVFNDSSEKTHIMTDIETIGYTVTAINAPKGADGNKTVNRTIHIIPANNVDYDFEVLTQHEYVSGSGYTGTWSVDGTYDSTKQNENNKEIHGYDSTLVTSGADDNYSFGRSYVTTVSANVRDDDGNITTYNNNDALTFTFKGTGFDVLSQTGPDEGVMVVEVFEVAEDGTVSAKATRVFMVDNYLKGTTLYQIPVVHCEDLEYGTYQVVIRAYYHDIFNHYEAPTEPASEKAAGTLMTEARIRQILGLSADVALEYTLSADRAKVTRAATATSYDVHVDGIRIYNTLGELSSSKTPVAYFAYERAGEANVEFFNARDLLLDSASWAAGVTEAGGITTGGMVYIAGDNIGNTGSDAMDTGIHLSMSGVLNYETVNGVNYLRDSDNNAIIHPEYNTEVYVEIDGSSCKYYCNDAEGEKIELTATEVGKLIGQDKIAFYNASYDVNSPKFEVYLTGENGLAFNAKGATLLQISMNSCDGAAVTLQAYDWTAGMFVPVSASTTNRTEMYYNLKPYMNEAGDVVICNNGDSIISISNIKVKGATITAPTSVVFRALRLIKGETTEETTNVLDENLTFSTSISVGAEMQIVYTIMADKVASFDQFYLEISKEVAGGEPIATVYTLNGDMNLLEALTNPATGEIVGYRATYTGINAKEMGDSFTATLYAVASDGSIHYSNANTTSIKGYLMGKLEDAEASDELKTLAVDMLNYGAAAQINFGYDTDNLVNADLTQGQLALGTQILPEANSSNTITGEGVNISTSIVLQSKVMLYLSCKYTANADSDLKFIIKDAASGDVLAELGLAAVAENGWQCSYDAVGARDMRKLLTIELYDNGTKVSKTVIWSIEGYVAETLAADTTTDVMRNMVNAMLTYGDSVAAYLAASGL